eukprot:GHVS01027714.1.p1 GENE.GHVS01027714.1~~GHVS01027714.1.p1  ORF type:complete len:143 (-),score=2.81 GHVS01027714.1:343-771(-)
MDMASPIVQDWNWPAWFLSGDKPNLTAPLHAFEASFLPTTAGNENSSRDLYEGHMVVTENTWNLEDCLQKLSGYSKPPASPLNICRFASTSKLKPHLISCRAVDKSTGSLFVTVLLFNRCSTMNRIAYELRCSFDLLYLRQW